MMSDLGFGIFMGALGASMTWLLLLDGYRWVGLAIMAAFDVIGLQRIK